MKWAGLEKAGPYAATVDISLLLESRDSHSPPANSRQSTVSGISSVDTSKAYTTSATTRTPSTAHATPVSFHSQHLPEPPFRAGRPVETQGAPFTSGGAPPPFPPFHPPQEPHGLQSGRPFFSGPPPPGPLPPIGTVSSPYGFAPPAGFATSTIPSKRTASLAPLLGESPPKKQGKWTPEEDALNIELRRTGMKWDDISKRLPGRTALSCRLRYQNYSEKRAEWDDEKKNKLARLYDRYCNLSSDPYHA